jgi:hypothetical protein
MGLDLTIDLHTWNNTWSYTAHTLPKFSCPMSWLAYNSNVDKTASIDGPEAQFKTKQNMKGSIHGSSYFVILEINLVILDRQHFVALSCSCSGGCMDGGIGSGIEAEAHA